MLSRKSYFNKSVFLNTLKRFWPLWLAYLVIWLLILPATQAVMGWSRADYHVQRDVLELARNGGALIGMGYSILAAMAVWSFMYNTKTMSGVACLPIRREGIFFSVTLAGLLPALVSNIVVFGLTALVHLGRGYASVLPHDAVALGVVTLMLIFFYGFAMLCAQLTGNLVTLPAVYAVLSFTAWIVETIVNYILDILVYGLNFGGNVISNYLSPVIGMFQGGARTERVYNAAFDEYTVVSVTYEGVGFLTACAAVGILFYAAAQLLFRRRSMESAGDVVAVQLLKPVFRYCLCFGCALVAGAGLNLILMSNGFDSSYYPLFQAFCILFFMLIGAFVGYFAAEMLIRKSFRVFRGRGKGYIISALVLCLCVLGVEFDALGVERRLPQADEVDYVRVNASDSVVYFQEENIEKIVALHSAAVENKAWHERGIGTGSSFILGYYMKDGSYMERSYHLGYDSVSLQGLEDVQALEDIQNSMEAIAWRKNIPFEAVEEKVLGGSFTGQISPEERMGLEEDMSEEDIILMYYFGYDEEYVRKYMDEAEKMKLIDEYLYQFGDSGLDGLDTVTSYGSYTWELEADEVWELYTDCILPDLRDGKIGKLWIVEDEEYFSTVCAGRVYIDFWYYSDEEVQQSEYVRDDMAMATPRETTEYYVGAGREIYRFSVTPTVGSRTYNWLADRGIIIHTVGEELGATQGFTHYGKYD